MKYAQSLTTHTWRSPYLALTAAVLALSVVLADADVYIAQTTDPNAYPGPTYRYNPADTNAFDTLMRTYAGEDVTVYIGPGTHLTRGYWNVLDRYTPPGFRVQNNARIYGVTGSSKPVLKLIDADTNTATATPENVLLSNGWGQPQGNIQITNLIIDCNGPVLTQSIGTNTMTKPMHLYGAEIIGTNISLIGLDVIGACNQRVTSDYCTETFILSINAPTTMLSVSNLIKGCTVSQFHNPWPGLGGCSAISLNKFPGNHDYTSGYIMGRVEDCSVTLNGTRGWGYGGEFAYNGTRTMSCVFSNNYAIGAERGFNNDTPYNRCITFVRNRFVIPAVSSGMLFDNDTSFSRVYENTMYLTSVVSSNGCAFNCSAAHDGFAGSSFMLFDHNSVVLSNAVNTSKGQKKKNSTSSDLPTYGFGLQPGGTYTPAVGINIENNMLNTGLTNIAPSVAGYFVRNTNAIGFPAGVNLGWRYSPCRADLNLDGNVDIVCQDANLTFITRFLTNGATLGTASLTPSHGYGRWSVVGSGDLDRDGRTDLIFQDTQYLDVAYWRMSDTYLTSAALIGGTWNPGGSWRVVATGDFNNDNRLDLLFQDANGYLKVWYLNGTSFGSEVSVSPNFSGNVNWKVAGTGDFNNDGSDDILFQWDNRGDPNDGKLMVWFMKGITRSSSQFINPSLPESPDLRVAAVGEFGMSATSPAYHTDILLQDRISGDIRIWFMSTTNRVTSTLYTGPGGTFKVVAPK